MSGTSTVPQGCYIYFILVDYKIRYIGKGTNGRAWDHEREARKLNEKRAAGNRVKSTLFYNRLASAIRKGKNVQVRIIKDGLSDREAFTTERLIIGMTRQFLPLYNQRDGGEGLTSEEARNLNSRKVVTPNGAFPSAVTAAEAYGISPSGAAYRAKRQSHGWRYADVDPLPEKKRLPSNRREIVTPIGRFETSAAAAKAYEIPHTTAYMRAKRQQYGWHFANCDPPPSSKRWRKKRSAVVTPTGQFESINAAAKACGIPNATAHMRAVKQLYGWHFANEALRPPEPKKNPHSEGRPVVTPLGIFSSIPEAAAAHEIKNGTAWMRAKKKNCGWHFADAA